MRLVSHRRLFRSAARFANTKSTRSNSLAYSKRPGHELVTSGIYSWSRHPSYAGFFWWAVGTQVSRKRNFLYFTLWRAELSFFLSADPARQPNLCHRVCIVAPALFLQSPYQ